MAIDVRGYKKKVLNQKPSINLVPFIDILFSIMIFLSVTSFHFHEFGLFLLS